ncbi:hypothetical protein PG994_013563 [Apiospora phragmitis]|uniref:Uncharacterized protein n=1 Tax=Apiospora phragmitis TaxID=2905665 RepID=A0ABR1T922_9PEZI
MGVSGHRITHECLHAHSQIRNVGTSSKTLYRRRVVQEPSRSSESREARTCGLKQESLSIRRHTTYHPGSQYTDPLDKDRVHPIGFQSDWLNWFEKWCDVHERLEPLPRGWHAALAEAHRQLAQARRDPAYARCDAWAPFDFEVPPYDDRWQAWDLVAAAGGAEMRRELRNRDPPRQFADLQQKQAAAGSGSKFRDEQALRELLDVQARTFLAVNAQGDPLPFLTISEVGAHREADDAWILVRGTTPRMMFTMSPSWKLVGKLAVPRLEAAVRENDGTDGLPLYKTYGKEVPILLSNPGGPIDESLPGFYPAMVSVISKYRCGYIMDPPSAPRAEADLTPFTARTLRFQDNPNLGVYFALGRYVYDMTMTDASELFAQWHSTDILLESPYDSMRIGRIVNEISVDQIQAHHVVLDKWVYDITVPDEGDACGLFRDPQEIGGTDATEILNDEGTPAPARGALGMLKANYQSRIVYRVRETEMAQVMFDDLTAHNDPVGPGAWVAIGDNVWDVTGGAGDEAWLQELYPHLLVVRLDLTAFGSMDIS